jgi:hypothetical protein
MSQPKKSKYPKKFRQTLEKIATGREAREGASDKDDPDDDPRFSAMYRSLLPRHSVHLMHSRLEETPFGIRLITRYDMKSDTDMVDFVRVSAPWEDPS